MGLAPSEPPQGVIDGLVLDAAWERVRQLEDELRHCRAMARQGREQIVKMTDRQVKLYSGLKKVISKYEGQDEPGTPLRKILGDLYRLLMEQGG